MDNLYQCTHCNAPYVATDPLFVAQCNGECLDCRRIEILRRFGLPADFLTRRWGPGG